MAPSQITPGDMDPDCAVCSAPSITGCECEAKALDTAVRQAEGRMMSTFFSEIRIWVRSHAQDYILTYFGVLSNRRHAMHATHMQSLTQHAAYYRQHPHPTEVARANAELKRGIDEDWRASVQKYPEVLEYFYSLVDWQLPSDDSQCVKDPPLSALGGAAAGGRKPKVRILVEDNRGGAGIPGYGFGRDEGRGIEGRPGGLSRRGAPMAPAGYSYVHPGF